MLRIVSVPYHYLPAREIHDNSESFGGTKRCPLVQLFPYAMYEYSW